MMAIHPGQIAVINAATGALFGAEKVDWLGLPEHIKPAIAFIVFWRFVGFNTVLYLAALQTIPADLYEAATMDGASRTQQFLHITLPQLKPMIYFGVTLSVIGGLQLFEEPFILTNGRGGADPALRFADASGGRYRGSQGLDPEFIKQLERQFGFEPVSLKFFTLEPEGGVHYLTAAEVEGQLHRPGGVVDRTGGLRLGRRRATSPAPSRRGTPRRLPSPCRSALRGCA